MAKSLADLLREARLRIKEISVDELDEMIEDHQDILLVDVRESEEFAKGHIPGAILVPRGTLEGAADPAYKHRVERLCAARERTVVLYCDTGSRSALATDTLQEMGFERVYNLAGGIEMWDAEGFAIVDDA